MRLSLLGVSLLVIGIVVLSVGVYTCAFPPATQTKTATLEPSAGSFEQLELNQGDKLQVTLTVTDGSAVRVTVEDPSSEIIYNGGTVFMDLEFNVNAETSGIHKIHFVNDSPTDQLTIDYSVTYPTFPGILTYSAIIVGLLLAVNGLALILISKRSNKKQ